jgi:hypothetical protein
VKIYFFLSKGERMREREREREREKPLILYRSEKRMLRQR